MSLLVLKAIHISSVVASFMLFMLRGIWKLNGSPIMCRRWVRIVPHFVDTLLLASAIALAFSIEQYPFVHAWLTAKVVALFLYIALGSVAMKYARSNNARITAWLSAQAVFAYIVLVAISHQPMPFIGN